MHDDTFASCHVQGPDMSRRRMFQTVTHAYESLAPTVPTLSGDMETRKKERKSAPVRSC